MCFVNRTQRTSNPLFYGEYSYHTQLPENPERPNSPNVLPMSRVMLRCQILLFQWISAFLGNWREQWDWSEDPLNFSESGWREGKYLDLDNGYLITTWISFFKKFGEIIFAAGCISAAITLVAFLLIPESRTDVAGVFLAGITTILAAFFFVWFFKKFPTPGVQFLFAFGSLAAFFLFAVISHHLGLEGVRGVFVIGMLVIVLLIITLAVVWIMKLIGKSNNKSSGQ